MPNRLGSSTLRLTLLGLLALAIASLPASAGARSATPRLSAGPGLIPHFNWGSSDYVIRCGRHRFRLGVSVPKGWEVRLDGSGWRRRSFEVKLKAIGGDGHRLVVRRTKGSSRRRAFNARCLPVGFPHWDWDRRRPGGPRLFGVNIGQYAIFFNGDGVPVWWYHSPHATPIGTPALADGTISWYTFQGKGEFEIRRPNGRLVRTVNSVHGATDAHDLRLLPNGHYLIGALVPRSGVDTTANGGSASATVLDLELEELSPKGKLLWSWSSADHIGLAETGRWWPAVIGGADMNDGAYDIVHWNSVAVKKHALLLSFRHLDAIYKINRDTGAIEWKLGGTHTPQSLQVLKDPLGAYPLGGQHDARFAGGGTITLHDNFSGLDPAPRVVRYRIDQRAGTATLISSLSDGRIPESFCCGSTRLLSGGSWLTSWGGDQLIAANRPDGKRIFSLGLKRQLFSYRAVPVSASQIRLRDLRRGMEAGRRYAAGAASLPPG
jgi:hypothetical protein